MLRRLNLIGLLLAFSTAMISSEQEIASLTLELVKGTLAIAEPVCLRVTLKNLSNQELVVNRSPVFGVCESHHLSIRVITPDEDEWNYIGSSLPTLYLPTAEHFFLLPPYKQIVERMILWWHKMWLPEEYRHNYQGSCIV
ncbi:hypothetical protein GF359_10460 [candidate division WOR-3 bacterium]|uniref:DUF1573 domain-containing protein n=1 Tax=candidate division WOR-3 bacterium TaxID=2052148 RepID=A0A9D5QDC7_UNCW3|nr:hypothetical protein [candidate division WOR-3 bacterium]MBD3365623.1 hypothetical protein [candidate division WOR-3 bacterium]